MSIKTHKIIKLLKEYTKSSDPLNFVGVALISALTALSSSGNPIGIMGICLIALTWGLLNFIFHRTSKYITYDQPPQPAKGLILLLSPFSSRNPLLKSPDKLNPLLDKIYQASAEKLTQADFEAIDILNSNLLPQIEAIKYHCEKKTLKEVWLITTLTYQINNQETGKSQTIKGSEETAIILEKYLRLQRGNQLEIHAQNFKDKSLTVKDREYAKLYELIDYIFKKSGYTNEVIIADITGGTKRMSVALAMACIAPKRKMQYMDSERDWEGNPLKKGEIEPVVIDVDPILYVNDD